MLLDQPHLPILLNQAQLLAQLPCHTHAPPDFSWVEEVVQVEARSGFGGAPPPGMGWETPMAPPEKYCCL
jgi:hypothetical protein